MNRPITFENTATNTKIVCSYDYLGRRATKTVQVNGVVTESRQFIYRGFLQIAAVDLTRSTLSTLWLLTWDPTEPKATQPLAIQQNGRYYTYGIDQPKNVTEVYAQNGYISTAYTYTPFGQVSFAGDVEQPFQWSSEFADTELGLVYYNYRHYNPIDGRWISRDPLGFEGGWNLYEYLADNPLNYFDMHGLNLFIRNTEEAYGYHWKICVTKWDKVSRKRTSCCVNGQRYEKTGQFCIGFGSNPGVALIPGSQSIAVSESSKSSKTNTDKPIAKQTPVPVGMKNVNGPNANGKITENQTGIDTETGKLKYVETGESPKHLPDVVTNCKEDLAIMDYMKGQVNQTADYSVFWRQSNCQWYAYFTYNHIIRYIINPMRTKKK